MVLRKILVTLLVSLFVLPVFGQTAFDYPHPSFQTVWKKFNAAYSVPEGNDVFRLEKRPDGWRAVLANLEGVTKSETFWDRKTNEYRKLSFPGQLDGEMPDATPAWKARRYNICPYFGYPGWAKEVTDAFGTGKNEPDSVLYGIGLAWEEYASNMLHNNSGNATESVRFDFEPGKNSLSDEQLSRYQKARNNAIEVFGKVVKMNPGLETLVGSIRTKWSNQHMTGFLDMLIYQNEKEAEKFLKKNLYDDFMLSWARNYLNSVDEDGILFTNGDNDTYALMYIQFQEQTRSDVSILNLSLLNNPDYAAFVRRGSKNFPKVSLSFSPEEIASEKFLYVLLGTENEYRDLSQVFNEFQKQLGKKIGEDKAPMSAGSKGFILPSDEMGGIPFMVDKPYLLRADVLVMDILFSNEWKRPVHFGTTAPRTAFLGLDDYLQQQGWAFKLVEAEPTVVSPIMEFPVNLERYEALLLNEFEWKGSNELLLADMQIMRSTRLLYLTLASAQVEAGKPEEAVKTLKLCEKLFPDNFRPFEMLYVYFAQFYYQAEAQNEGDRVVKNILRHLRTGKGSLVAPEYAKNDQQRKQMGEFLQQLLERYDRNDLLMELEDSLLGNGAHENRQNLERERKQEEEYEEER